MDNWDEIRTAYKVARIGTVSGAADALGVHHATVIRHVDALESRLGVKLFQRHARGYTPTDAGNELLRVGNTIEDQFSQMTARINGAVQEMSGELIVTSIPGLADHLAPALSAIQRDHPALVVRYLTDLRVYRLEYAEAHVAIRAGARPAEPDYVVQPLFEQAYALYASKTYVAAMGLPASEAEFSTHRFVGSDDPQPRAPFLRWLSDSPARDRIVFRSNDQAALMQAVIAGAGIGFLPVRQAQDLPDMVEVMADLPEWTAQIWIVTHVDLHRSPKVQAFLKALKAACRSQLGE